MTLEITHKFESQKGDPPDATKIRPSNWNDDHDITMAANKLIGKGDGAGAAEEFSWSAFTRALLATSNLVEFVAALGAGVATTGDFLPTLQTVAPAGWVMCTDGTIGDETSGATRANADTAALFALIWDNVSNTYAPILTSAGGVSTRGANAAADYAAHKRLSLTKMLGRALAAAGSGTGLTARTLGQTLGAETHQLTIPELPKVTPAGSVAAHTHNVVAPTSRDKVFVTTDGVPSGDVWGDNNGGASGSEASGSATPAFTGTEFGGDTAHPNMQPTTFVNIKIKL